MSQRRRHEDIQELGVVGRRATEDAIIEKVFDAVCWRDEDKEAAGNRSAITLRLQCDKRANRENPIDISSKIFTPKFGLAIESQDGWKAQL